MKHLRALLLLSALALAMVVGLAAMPSRAADHLDAPLVQADSRTDINDLYVFQSPENPNNTVLIMTVNPLAGAGNPTTFKPGAKYNFRVDTNGDAVEDVVYEVKFDGVQQDGSQRLRAVEIEDGGMNNLGKGKTGQTVHLRQGAKAYAGVFDDPFFFDLIAFQNGLAFCPTDPAPDFFAGLNVSAIALEIPTWMIGTSNIGVWATTDDGGQIDRIGRPAINTVFISSKDAFNAGHPVNDQADFRGELVGTLLALGNDMATADALADVLLPDILTVDTSSSAGFLNGRQLADDVIDAELSLITGGAVPTDCVDANDHPFSSSFPYLASAN